MRKITIVLTLALSLLTSGLALAHEGRKHASHLMGTVTAMTAKQIEIRTKDGKTVQVPLTAGTKYLQGTRKATKANVKKGMRVILELGAKGVAEEVRLSAVTTASAHATAGH